VGDAHRTNHCQVERVQEQLTPGDTSVGSVFATGAAEDLPPLVVSGRRSIMRVVEFDSTHEAMEICELEGILMKRHLDGVNAFWLRHGNDEYPVLSILVRGEVAVLHYLPAENVAGFRSAGTLADLPPCETTSFAISKCRADDVEVLTRIIHEFGNSWALWGI
jgi:hypothetical protein